MSALEAPTLPEVTVQDVEVFADDLDLSRAAAIYNEYGCLVVRGLMKPYVEQMSREIDFFCDQSLSLLDKATVVPDIGWNTPDGTLFLPAPETYGRDKQIMVLGYRYAVSGTFFQSAFDKKLLDIVEEIIGADIELFAGGQCLVKEPVGGHPKHLHQDSAYFEHKYEGPVGILSYVVDTDLVNGALHVVPGSKNLGQLKHIDTFSHLGLDPNDWPWERALPICGSAGDSIFFHVRTIHGSKQNHSDKRRPVFIHRYRRPDDFTVISAATTAKREEAEKLKEKVKAENQQGLMVRGLRKYQG